MITGPNTILHLLQLTDSALPIGGFSFSQGMESALKHGLIKTHKDVERYLFTFTKQLVSFDLPYVNSAYEAYPDFMMLKEMAIAFEAMVMNQLIRKSAEVMGKNLVSLIVEICPKTPLDQWYEDHLETKSPLYFPIAFGAVCKELKVQPDQWMEAYLYAMLRDQVSAMTRLNLVGSKGGQALLATMLARGNTLLQEHRDCIRNYTEASRSAYMLELAQLNHSTLYSRLFQN